MRLRLSALVLVVVAALGYWIWSREPSASTPHAKTTSAPAADALAPSSGRQPEPGKVVMPQGSRPAALADAGVGGRAASSPDAGSGALAEGPGFAVRSQTRWLVFQDMARSALDRDADEFIGIHRDLCIELQQHQDLLAHDDEISPDDAAVLLADAFEKRNTRVEALGRFKDLRENEATMQLSIDLALPWVGACLGEQFEMTLRKQMNRG